MARPALDDVDLVLRTMSKTIVDNTEYFSQLDAVVGDGDFGYSLRSGFEVVGAELDSFDHSSVGSVLKKVGLTMSAKVGGSSGPFWGTAFLRAGITAGDRTELAPEDLIAMLRAAVEGIMARGNASLGEKTLLDALVPAIDSLEESFSSRSPTTAWRRSRRPPTWRLSPPRTPRACSPCAAAPRTPASAAATPSMPARPPSA